MPSVNCLTNPSSPTHHRRTSESPKGGCGSLVRLLKTFDSIRRDTVFSILCAYEIPLIIVEAIKTTHINSSAVVTPDGETEFSINSIVLKGDPVAPLLFITVLD